MNITSSTIQKIIISNAPHPSGFGSLDPIAVMIEDMDPGQGKITITCFGDAWTHYWSHMGENNTLVDFFLKADNGYLVGKLKNGIRHEIDDLDSDRMEVALKTEIVRLRKEGDITHEEARRLWNSAQCVDEHNYVDIFQEVSSDEWWSLLPKKRNPEYDHLSGIVMAVKTAFQKMKEVKVEVS